MAHVHVLFSQQHTCMFVLVNINKIVKATFLIPYNSSVFFISNHIICIFLRLAVPNNTGLVNMYHVCSCVPLPHLTHKSTARSRIPLFCFNSLAIFFHIDWTVFVGVGWQYAKQLKILSFGL